MTHDPITSSTHRYYNDQARFEKTYEGCEKEVVKMTDKDLIDYIQDFPKLENRYYDFIMKDLRLTYCKLAGRNPDIMPTQLGGIPNLLIELFQRENYLAYFWNMDDDQQKEFRRQVAEFMAEKIENEREDV